MAVTKTVSLFVPHSVLVIVSWLYRFVVVCRNKGFDWGILRSTKVPVSVISVGNMTVGGTGKTPLVEYVVAHCLRSGKRIAILSRGYKRESRGVVVVSDGRSVMADALKGGDEPVQMARKFPSAIVVVGERRVEAARVAVHDLGAEIVVLDDGFQHRYLHRDLDIVVVSAKRDGGLGLMVPAGRVREPWPGIRRANVVALSKVDSRFEVPQHLMAELSRWYTGPTIRFRYRIESVRRLADGARVQLEEVKKQPVLAFSAIGDPDSFVEDLNAAGFTVKGSLSFPDHHTYSVKDARRVVDTMHHTGAYASITTEKDMVRLLAIKELIDSGMSSEAIYYTCISVELTQGEERFLSMIDACLQKKVNE